MSFRRMASLLSVAILILGLDVSTSLGFSNGGNQNLAVYWGQNSYGATHTDTSNWQKPLSVYCQDDAIDAIPLAFLNVYFDQGGLPSIDLSNTCNVKDNAVFPGTQLADCSFMASDIETCQAAGKIVTISLGGATGAASFSSDAQAESFAQTVWDIFLGGSSSTRPFGSAVLDGIDLDIEGGSSAGYPAFVNKIRALSKDASKPYYVTGAPQCPFPDAYMGSIINAVGFDALYVQFYNNYCGLNSYSNPNGWDFGDWDNWAKNTSPNPNVKIYIGAPASSTSANSGYVDSNTVASIIQATRTQYSSFGGIMLWDASQAYANNRYDIAMKNILVNGGSTGGPTSPTKTTTTVTTTTTTTSASSTPTVGPGQCGEVPSWVSNVAYTAGSQVVYGGHLWTAKYWTQANAPGGPSGSWIDNGICSSAATERVYVPAYHRAESRSDVTPRKASRIFRF